MHRETMSATYLYGTLRNDGIRITGIDDTPKSDWAQGMQRAILPPMLPPSGCRTWIDRDHTQILATQGVSPHSI